VEEEATQLPPDVVLEQLRAHDERMRAIKPQLALIKSLWRTRYWDHVRGEEGSGAGEAQFWNRLADVEVNRIWPIITAYMSSLYPRNQRVVLGEDAAGQGDPDKGAIAINRWLAAKRVHLKVMRALRQGLLYHGVGTKLGYEPGYGSPLDRVFMRVFPWWECVLDSDVTDPEDARFWGHAYYAPQKEIEQKYGLSLKGSGREDFLESGTSDGFQTNDGTSDKSVASEDRKAFVRVLEVCNMVDPFIDEGGTQHQGRFEVYILDQGELSDEPVFAGPMPFANSDGTPQAHIKPLIFNSEPEFPLRGIPHAQRIIPQLKELNIYRTFQALSSRKDARQYLVRKSALGNQSLTELEMGVDGLILEVEDDQVPLDDIVVAIKNAPISINIDNYLREVERDLDRAAGTSPNARGIVTKATAFEVQNVQQYTESDFGMHAQILEWWLEEVVQLFLRVLISAMQDDGSYMAEEPEQMHEVGEAAIDDLVSMLTEEGDAEDDAGDDYGDEGEDDEDDEGEDEESTDEEEALLAQITGAASVAVDGDAVEPIGETEVSEGEVTIKVTPLVLVHQNEVVEILPQDLDAEFAITFLEGASTPGNDARLQSNLINLLAPMGQLWDQANQTKDHMAHFAMTYLRAIANSFDLPRDLHPDVMMASYKRSAEDEGGEPEPEPEDDAVLAEGDAAAGGPPAAPDPAQLQALLTMPPEEALAALSQMGAPEELLQQIAALPDPQAQAMAISDLVEQLMQQMAA